MEILAEAVKMAFGPKEILKGIDFSLHNKEFVGIIGPNGSGKSTFLKCVYQQSKQSQADEQVPLLLQKINHHHFSLYKSGYIPAAIIFMPS